MNPLSFCFITDSLTCRGPVRGIYELKYKNGDVIESPVLVRGMKMSPNGVVQVWGCDASKVAFESFFDGVQGLPYILLLACVTANAVNEVVSVACDIFHGSVISASCFASDGA